MLPPRVLVDSLDSKSPDVFRIGWLLTSTFDTWTCENWEWYRGIFLVEISNIQRSHKIRKHTHNKRTQYGIEAEKIPRAPLYPGRPWSLASHHTIAAISLSRIQYSNCVYIFLKWCQNLAPFHFDFLREESEQNIIHVFYTFPRQYGVIILCPHVSRRQS